MHQSPISKLLFRFSFQTAILALLFGLVAAAYVSLWYARQSAEHHILRLIVRICGYIPELMFVLDLTCLLFLFGVGFWKVLRGVWGRGFRPQ